MKITFAKFNELQTVPYVVENKKEKKELKFKLLDGVQEALGEKWYNLKQNTKQGLQYLCMRSTEQGFCFCSPKHMKEKYNMSFSNTYTLLRELIDGGIICRVNRPAKEHKHNGNGSAVYIFTKHPNFELISSILELDWKADCKADWKAENAQNPCGSKAESDKKASTYSLPTPLPKELKDNNVKHYNVGSTEKESSGNTQDGLILLKEKMEAFKEQAQNEQVDSVEPVYVKPTVKYHKYVPKAINEKFAYFGDLLTDLWRKIKLAERKVNIADLSKEDKYEVAEKVLSNLRQHPNFKYMSADEMCAYVYKGHLNGLFNLAGNRNLETMFIDDTYGYYAYVDSFGNHHVTKDCDDDDIVVVVDDNGVSFNNYFETINYDYDSDDVSGGAFRESSIPNWLEWGNVTI